VLRELVEQGDIEQAITKTNEFFPNLLSQRADVMLALRSLQFIELVRSGTTEEALSFMQSTVRPFLNSDTVEAIEVGNLSSAPECVLSCHSFSIASTLSSVLTQTLTQTHTYTHIPLHIYTHTHTLSRTHTHEPTHLHLHTYTDR
jgi:CTLH/CRA C-terminal to LisH motif domain